MGFPEFSVAHNRPISVPKTNSIPQQLDPAKKGSETRRQIKNYTRPHATSGLKPKVVKSASSRPATTDKRATTVQQATPRQQTYSGHSGYKNINCNCSGLTTKLATKRQPIKANLVAATPSGSDTRNNQWKNSNQSSSNNNIAACK